MDDSLWAPAIKATAEAAAVIIPAIATLVVAWAGYQVVQLRGLWAARAAAQKEAAEAAATASQAATHAADVKLIRDALATSAMNTAAGLLNNTIPTVEEAARIGVAYALNPNTVGATIAKVGVSSEALADMARAAVTEARAKLAATMPQNGQGGL